VRLVKWFGPTDLHECWPRVRGRGCVCWGIRTVVGGRCCAAARCSGPGRCAGR
jgi:hypothetical protein